MGRPGKTVHSIQNVLSGSDFSLLAKALHSGFSVESKSSKERECSGCCLKKNRANSSRVAERKWCMGLGKIVNFRLFKSPCACNPTSSPLCCPWIEIQRLQPPIAKQKYFWAPATGYISLGGDFESSVPFAPAA